MKPIINNRDIIVGGKLLGVALLALSLLGCAGVGQITPAAQQGQSELSQGKAEIVNAQATAKAASSNANPIGQALIIQTLGALGRAAQHLDNGIAKFNAVVVEDGKKAQELAIEHTWWFGWRTHQLAKWTLITLGVIAFIAIVAFTAFLGIVNGLAGPVGGTAAAGWFAKAMRYVITLGLAGVHDLFDGIGRAWQIGLQVAQAAKTIKVGSSAAGTEDQPIAHS